MSPFVKPRLDFQIAIYSMRCGSWLHRILPQARAYQAKTMNNTHSSSRGLSIAGEGCKTSEGTMSLTRLSSLFGHILIRLGITPNAITDVRRIISAFSNSIRAIFVWSINPLPIFSRLGRRLRLPMYPCCCFRILSTPF